MKKLFLILAIATELSAQTVPTSEVFSEQRKKLQGAFSVCNSKIYPNPDKATVDAHIELERVARQIKELKYNVLEFESGHCNIWYSESYWARSYWNSNSGGRFLVQKLRTSMNTLSSLQTPEFGPFTRPDLNTLQKVLDACRACLEVDCDLEQAAKNYSAQRVYYVPSSTTRQKLAPYSDGTTSSF